MRRRFWGLLVAALVLVPVAPARATVPVVIIDGRGFGHGVGMAQDGAFWMAKAGATAPQILGHFYPGTSVGKVANATVRVSVFDNAVANVGFPAGGRIDERDGATPGAGFPIVVEPGGSARLRMAGGTIVVDTLTGARANRPAPTPTTAPATTTTTRPAPQSTELLPRPTTTSTTTARVAAPATSAASAAADAPLATTRPLVFTPRDGGTVTVLDRQRTYRGFIDVFAHDTTIKLVNQVAVEQYLRGMGEVRDPSWPQAALRTQAIAARTYALRAMGAAGELCDNTRCQVYLGQQAEYGAMDKAVSATAGQVLVFNKGLASAVYSSNGGGHSASREEGFGTTGGDYPYLRAAPYDTKNPMPWSVTVGLADLSARLGHVDITGAEVIATGPSGRATSVALDGPGGRRAVTGLAFARALGLRSTMFTVRMGTADVAPAALGSGVALQAPPDEVALTDAPAEAVTDQPLLAPALALPDRPSPLRSVMRRASSSASLPEAAGALALAVGLMLVASWRRPGGVARLRSWRGARPPAGGHQ
jgi:SpoIID/LytB domain protein